MIQEISVQGLRLLENMDLSLAPGLVAITGETGAGKSLFIKAIQLALGEALDEEMAKQSEAKAKVQLLMKTSPKFLEREELPEGDQPGELLLSRDIAEGAKGRLRLNGEIIPLKKMKTLSSKLLDIHSQDARILLKDKNRQLALFDLWAGAGVLKEKEKLAEILPKWQQARKIRLQFEENQDGLIKEQEENTQFLSDLEEGLLSEEKETELKRQAQALSAQAKLVEGLGTTLQALEGEDIGAVGLLSTAAGKLEDLAGILEEFTESAGRCRHLAESAQVLSRELSERLEEVTEGGVDLDSVQEQLFLHEKLCRRFRKSGAELWRWKEKLQTRQEELSSQLGNPEDLQKREEEFFVALKLVLENLAKARKSKTKAFEKVMTEALVDLAFNQVRFEIHLETFAAEEAKKDTGNQQLQFMVSFNPGEPVRTLEAVASGGEVGRLALALKSVLSENFDISCLIFDEIDAGVGGRVAEAMAKQLQKLASSRQVMVITHNHWVAAQAGQHLCVQKEVKQGKTIIRLVELKGTEREDEVVRMLGEGSGGAKAARQFAKEILGKK